MKRLFCSRRKLVAIDNPMALHVLANDHFAKVTPQFVRKIFLFCIFCDSYVTEEH